MRNVPVIDATGINTIKDVLNMCNKDETRLYIKRNPAHGNAGTKEIQVLFKVGKRYVTSNLEMALVRARKYLLEIYFLNFAAYDTRSD